MSEFSTIVNTATYLMVALYGNFEYSTFDFEPKEVPASVGYVYITVFMFVNAIVLFNFLIAILSNTYERSKNQSKGLYLNHIVRIKQ